MHPTSFIADLAVIMLAAAAMAILCQFLKQPVVIGYILAGVLVGPHVPILPVVTDKETIAIMAELGLVMLMFTLGLEFSFRKLQQVGATAIVVAIVKVLFIFWLGFEIGRLFQWSDMDALFLGGLLSISSTTIIYKALDEMGLKREPFARLIIGILIVEDIIAIAIIAILTGIAKTNAVDADQVAMTLVRLSIFLVVSVMVGILIVPRLISRVGRIGNNELLLLTVLGLCFGLCLLVIKLDYSVALGAFLIGAVIAESGEVLKITRLVEPIRVMFSAVFFVSIGLLLDPIILKDYLFPIVIITAAVVVGKICSSIVGGFLSGQSGLTSVQLGMGLAQIGEFSFVIAALGASLNVTSHFLYPMAVAISVITTLMTPYLIRAAAPTSRILGQWLPRRIAIPLGYYTEWLQSIRMTREHTPATTMIRRILRHVVINLVVVAAIFIAITFLSDPGPGWVSRMIEDERLRRTAIWLFAAIVSLPFLIAIYRKLQALAMILAELSVNPNQTSRLTPKVRSVLAGVIPLGAVGILTLFVSALSSPLLPPLDLLLVVAVIVVLIGLAGWRSFTKIHAGLHAALRESFKTNSSG